MEKEKLTRLKVLRVMSYDFLHFLIREKILSVFLTECLNNSYSWVLKRRIEQGIFQNRSITLHNMYEFENYLHLVCLLLLLKVLGGDMHLNIGRSIHGKSK